MRVRVRVRVRVGVRIRVRVRVRVRARASMPPSRIMKVTGGSLNTLGLLPVPSG